MMINARIVTPEVFSAMTGYKVQQVERNIRNGIWREGHEIRTVEGKVHVDLDGFEAWVLSGYTPAAAPEGAAPAARLRDLPTALYRHFDASGALLYVGVSLSPLGRLEAHAQRSHWTRSVARVEIAWYPDRRAALAAELLAIRNERPQHNIAGAIREAGPC